MNDVKTVNISGGAAEYMTGAKKKRRSTKKKQEGGEQTPIILKGIESTASIAATSSSTNSNTWLKYPSAAPVPPQIHATPSHIPSYASVENTVQQGGKNVKVELKKKISAKKVHLNPKKDPTVKKQTKKVRKITLGMKTFHRRITRAKKLHKTVKEIPLDKLKEKLIKDGLIKSTSKAPESILRQIASDAEVVAKKAL